MTAVVDGEAVVDQLLNIGDDGFRFGRFGQINRKRV